MSIAENNIAAPTALHRSPFHVIKATTRDGRSRLVELADEQGLVRDPNECRDAQNALTNLRTRLNAELGWLPGVAPRKASQLVHGLVGGSALAGAGELPPLARANVLAGIIETLTDGTKPGEVVSLILDLAETVDAIDLEAVLRDVNEDRSVAGFPPVREINSVEEEFDACRRHYRNVTRDLIDKFPRSVLVNIIDLVVTKSTAEGTRHAHSLIQDLVEAYETGAQDFIQQQVETVSGLLDRARSAAEHGEPHVLKTIEEIKSAALIFSSVVKPIQVVSRANGLDHPASRDLAIAMRHLAIELHNEHSMFSVPAQITEFLQSNFPAINDIADQVSEVIEYLRSAQEAKCQAEANKQEFDRSISYSAEIGIVFKDRVQISPAGIYWRNNHLPLETITRIRWGGTRHSVNGIPTGTALMIFVGNNRSSFTIDMRNKEVYGNLVDRLWRAVGVRLLVEQVSTLKKGGGLQFPDAIIRDNGVTLTRHRVFGVNEKVDLPWAKTRVWSQDGNFVISAQDDKKVYASMSYQNADNVHVLEHLIRAFFKSDKRTPGQLFD
jgi:hypothetical protein